MKKELIGIIICMLLVGSVFPISGQVINSNTVRENDEKFPLINGDKWIKTYGGPGMDYGKMVQITNDGCYIVAGDICIDPGDPPDYDGDWDYWLIKIDAMGDIIWDKTFSLYGYDICSAFRQTSDDGFILVGYSRGLVYPWDSAVWLIKTDKNGVKKWDKTYFEGGGCGREDVIQTSDGGYAIILPDGHNEINIIRTNDTGDIIWDKKMIGIHFDNFADIIKQTLDGGFIITGYKGNRAGIMLVKLDSDGNILWEKTFVKGTNNYGVYSLQLTNDGGYIICGYLYGYPGIGQPEGTWIIKTDSEGELIWDSKIGSSTDDIVSFSVQQTIDNGYIIAGRTDPLFLEYDPVLIKVDSEGQVEWRKTFDYFRFDMVNSVQQTADGGYIALGSVGRHFNSDLLLIKTDSEGNTVRNRAFNRPSSGLFEELINFFPILKLLLQRLVE